MKALFMRHNSFVILFVVSLVLLVPLGALAQTNIVHLVYSNHGDPYREFLEALADEFNAQNPSIQVDIVLGPGGNAYREKVVSMLAGGVAPDVTDHTEALMGELIQENVFLDLAPYFHSDATVDYDDFIPVVFQAVTAPDGSVIGMPFDIYPIVTFYNSDLLGAAGLQSPNDMSPDDWTWDMFLGMAKKATLFSADGSPVQYGLGQPTNRWWNYIVQAGGKMYDRPLLGSTSHWNSPEVLVGVEWARSLMVDHQVAPPHGMAGANQFNFDHGRSAFSLSWGPGMASQWLKNAAFSWDVALQPMGPANRGAQVAVNSMQILADSEHPDAAWEWVKFVAANENSARRYMSMTGRLPTLLAVQTEFPDYAADQVLPDNWIRYFETAMDPASFTTYVPYRHTSVNAIVDAALGQVWRGETAPSAAVQQIHAQVSAIFEQSTP